MLQLSKKISDLNDYQTNFTREEKEQLTKCFNQIQEYIKNEYLDKTSSLKVQIHYNPYTQSQLVIDFNEGVYLVHANHSGSGDRFYFNGNERNEIWKYTLALLVVQNWKEIKQLLDKQINHNSVKNLCDNFIV